MNEILPNDRYVQLEDKARGVLLGAAVGDALGWPLEDRSQVLKGSIEQSRPGEFARWIRKSGGRFQPHHEVIDRGQYSDDTQLIIATATSLRAGSAWFARFTQTELPLWTMYERGGGRAVLSAARSWVDGTEPWRSKNGAQYFAAGGNGVAMRIAPHVLIRARTSFADIAAEIVQNGIATHGHPRALVGALAYGYALHRAFHHRGTLGYGHLIEALLRDIAQWSACPAFTPEWIATANRLQSVPYEDVWSNTVDEMVALLERSLLGISQHALSVDDDVLRDLGIYEKKGGGAGTVTAASAIFLASKYAASPEAGVVRSAQLRKADTDTIASMTAGLLGAVTGQSGVSKWLPDLQDVTFLEQTATALVTGTLRPIEALPVRTRETNGFLETIASKKTGESLNLPDGRVAEVEDVSQAPAKSGKFTVHYTRVRVEGGPTLFLRRIIRSGAIQADLIEPTPLRQAAAVKRLGMRLETAQPGVLRHFYEFAIGLPITKASRASVTFGGILQLVHVTDENGAGNPPTDPRHGTIVWVEVASIQNAHERVRAYGVRATNVESASNRTWFRCADPEGNPVEIFQVTNREE